MGRSTLGPRSDGKEITSGGHGSKGRCEGRLEQTKKVSGPKRRDTEEGGGEDDVEEVFS